MMDPRYREIGPDRIPEIILESGVRIKIICGKIDQTRGAVQDVVIDPEYLDVTVPAGANFGHPLHSGYTAFAYVLDGKGYFEPERDPYHYEMDGENYFDFKRDCLLGAENLIIFADGDEINVVTENEGVRFLLISGRPIKEPVAWYGPIVMNTREELQVAFEEYQQGTFLKRQKK
jgi:redox-sensitive bicupin YhaK (pirin superfamily)